MFLLAVGYGSWQGNSKDSNWTSVHAPEQSRMLVEIVGLNGRFGTEQSCSMYMRLLRLWYGTNFYPRWCPTGGTKLCTRSCSSFSTGLLMSRVSRARHAGPLTPGLACLHGSGVPRANPLRAICRGISPQSRLALPAVLYLI